MNYRWIPIHGLFHEEKNGVVFKGSWEESPQTGDAAAGSEVLPEKLPSLGIILSDQEISDGSITADVTFAAIGRVTGCEIIVNFDLETRSYLAAGISGFQDAMFSIREWLHTRKPAMNALVGFHMQAAAIGEISRRIVSTISK